MKRSLILIAALATLAACTEKPQTLSSGVKLDAAAFQGTGMAFTARAGSRATGPAGSRS